MRLPARPTPRPVLAARHSAQRGVSLVIVLLFLIILTLLGVSASMTSLSSERLARNARDQNIALQAAEAALRDARTDIGQTRGLSGRTGASADCSVSGYKGFCLPADSGSPVWDLQLENPDHSVQLGEITGAKTLPGASTPGGVSKQPRYIIEALPDVFEGSLRAGSTTIVYRVTAMGYGSNPDTRVMLQEVVRF